MSWDAIIMQYGDDLPPMNELPKGWKPEPLASNCEQLRFMVAQVFPEIEWGMFVGHHANLGLGGSGVELSFSEDEPPEVLHIRAVGGNPVADLMRLCDTYGWRLLDCSTGEFIKPGSTTSEGVEGYLAYRKRVTENKDRKE